MLPLYNICWLLLAQITPGASTAEGATEAAGEAAKKPGMFDTLTFFLPAMLIVMALYFLMMGRPQEKGQVKGSTPERLNESIILSRLESFCRFATEPVAIISVLNSLYNDSRSIFSSSFLTASAPIPASNFVP